MREFILLQKHKQFKVYGSKVYSYLYLSVVEVLGSLMTIGYSSGIVGGLLLEHSGIRKTGYISLSTALAYLATLVTLYHPEGFNGKLFPILIGLFLLKGKSKTPLKL